MFHPDTSLGSNLLPSFTLTQWELCIDWKLHSFQLDQNKKSLLSNVRQCVPFARQLTNPQCSTAISVSIAFHMLINLSNLYWAQHISRLFTNISACALHFTIFSSSLSTAKFKCLNWILIFSHLSGLGWQRSVGKFCRDRKLKNSDFKRR